MGNNPSQQQQGSSSGGSGNARHGNIRQLLRNTGALGLSKAELDARCKPSGLYPNCQWDDKQIRRLIGDGKLAARLKGEEVRRKETDTECPICFLNYAQVNQTKCCQGSLCTECYLQVRPPKEKVACPFCNSSNLVVTLQQTLSQESIRERQEEEERALAAATKSRDPSAEEQAPGFGSAMDQDENVALMRKRSSSMSDAGSDTDLSSVAMTVDERQRLEAQLRAQQQSPLIQRMQQEEMERAFRNEREYLQQNAGRDRQRSSRGSRRRDWARLIQAFEEGGGIQSMDDLAMLEAAMRMASMDGGAGRRAGVEEEEGGPSPLRRRMLDSRSSRRETGSESSNSFLGGSAIASQLIMRGMSEEDQLAMAIAASLQESAANQESANAEESSAAENDAQNSESTNTGVAESSAEVTESLDQETGAMNVHRAQTTDGVPDATELLRERADSGPVDLDVSFSESNDDYAGDFPSAAGDVAAVEGSAAISSVNVAAEPTQPNTETGETNLGEVNPEAAPIEPVDTVDININQASVTVEQVSLEREGEATRLEAPPLTVATTGMIIAQTGLPISEVLGGVDSTANPLAVNLATVDTGCDATPEPHVENQEPFTVEKPSNVQDVQEAETCVSSEHRPTEEIKLPDETITLVATNSILPQDSKDKTVETVESGMSSCEA